MKFRKMAALLREGKKVIGPGCSAVYPFIVRRDAPEAGTPYNFSQEDTLRNDWEEYKRP